MIDAKTDAVKQGHKTIGSGSGKNTTIRRVFYQTYTCRAVAATAAHLVSQCHTPVRVSGRGGAVLLVLMSWCVLRSTASHSGS
jgi:hypothetical protein